MTAHSAKAAVLWTGGKDSALALHDVPKKGSPVSCLVTFAPPNAEFRAHPLEFMRLQAEALGLPHHVLEVKEPFRQGYETALAKLKAEHGIDTVITGDIAEVDGQPNWIRECSRMAGMEVVTPLWDADRVDLMKRLIAKKFEVVFSCVKRPWLGPKWAGRTLDERNLEDLIQLSRGTGMDVCGENGEYHTLVCHAPLFQRRIHIQSSTVETSEDMAWLKIEKAVLQTAG